MKDLDDVNLAKLNEIDQEIKHLEKLYKNARDRDDEDVEVSEELREQLRDKQDKRSARLEAVSTNERALRSQISRIKETFRRILEKDVKLGKKINTLFREQGTDSQYIDGH